ncbi:Uncharacterised protein [uncultured archaeon]|nr:Uncharacterised protein [uncultured archaeon]
MTISQKLEAKRKEAVRTWTLACEHDGVDQKNVFVVFSDGNPYAADAGNAAVAYREAAVTYNKLMSVKF